MTRKLFLSLTVLIQFVFVAVVAHQLWRQDWTGAFVAAQAILVSFAPYLIKRYFGFHTPFALRVGIVFFMFGTLVLGEMADFYNTYWWWDLIFHGLASVGLTLLVFIFLLIFFEHIDLKAAPLFTTFLALGTSMFMSVLWEIYEFLIDFFFETDTPMQPSNTDTMMDLVVALAGALLVAWSGYRYVKWRKVGVVTRIIHDGARKNAG